MAPFRRKPKGEATRIFFAADLHGSEPTFRKFLNAASFYDVDALVFGAGNEVIAGTYVGGRWRATGGAGHPERSEGSVRA